MNLHFSGLQFRSSTVPCGAIAPRARLVPILLALRVLTLACIALTPRARDDAWPPASQYLAQHPPIYTGIVRTSRYLTMRDAGLGLFFRPE